MVIAFKMAYNTNSKDLYDFACKGLKIKGVTFVYNEVEINLYLWYNDPRRESRSLAYRLQLFWL